MVRRKMAQRKSTCFPKCYPPEKVPIGSGNLWEVWVVLWNQNHGFEVFRGNAVLFQVIAANYPISVGNLEFVKKRQGTPFDSRLSQQVTRFLAETRNL